MARRCAKLEAMPNLQIIVAIMLPFLLGMGGFAGPGFDMPGGHGFGAPDGASGPGMPGFRGGSGMGNAGGM